MEFQFKKLRIPDVILIQPKVFKDERGFFAEIFKASEFEQAGIKERFVQSNHSKSQKNILRGLHYQLNPKVQAKLVRVISGEVFDVAVDIRKGSPTFGGWVGERISSQNMNMLFIPVGFAHGFCVLSDDAEVIYYCSGEYSKELERGIIWNDPALKIEWPTATPFLSQRDKDAPLLKAAEVNFTYSKVKWDA